MAQANAQRTITQTATEMQGCRYKICIRPGALGVVLLVFGMALGLVGFFGAISTASERLYAWSKTPYINHVLGQILAMNQANLAILAGMGCLILAAFCSRLEIRRKTAEETLERREKCTSNGRHFAT